MAKNNRGMNTDGMRALFGDLSLEKEESASGDFIYVPVSRVQPRKNQPRVTFDQQPLEELAQSVREHGVLTPIAVRSVGDGYYEIIAGERRWRAARMAELEQIPARVLNVDDRGATEIALIENLQREDLNPLEEALGYLALSEDYGLTQEEIARRMGKSRPAVTNAMRLLVLPEEAREMVRERALAPGSARALLAINDRDALVRAAREVVERGLSSRDAEKLAKKYLRAPKSSRTAKNDAGAVNSGNYLQEFEQNLGKMLGRRVRIVSNGKNAGKFEIDYYDAEDFERLYNSLSSLGEENA